MEADQREQDAADSSSRRSSRRSSDATRANEPAVILEEGDLEAASHTTAIIVDFDGKDDPSDPKNWTLRWASPMTCIYKSLS